MSVGNKTRQGSLRQRILIFISSLVLLSLLGSTISLYRITEVNRLLDVINRVSIPLGRLFSQMQADADVFRRELDRALGYSHWKDPHWKPRPIPRWIEDVLQSEVERAGQLLRTEMEWTTPDSRARWREWALGISEGLANLRAEAARLYRALEHKDEAAASAIYPRWTAAIEDWRRQLQWGALEYERLSRQTFSLAESRVAELRTGLEMILAVVVLLSLMLLWLGDRALRPLGELTRLAREITRRGLRKEDKALLPEIPLSRKDEVSSLAREFHRMATALLEREKTVESQKHRLQEQNRLLRDIGALNENILNSIESVLIVADLEGKITQCNPVAAKWLESDAETVIGSPLADWPRLTQFLRGFSKGSAPEPVRIEPLRASERMYGGHLMPLKRDFGSPGGVILVLDDLTDEIDMQDRLRRAENLAAVGRLSAQVAHEVRNPLHSIGLEAEMASELAGKTGSAPLRQSLQSILSAVDRLEKITENYLKLSRLSDGHKTTVDLGTVLESVLAMYATECESQGVRVDWKREPRSDLAVCVDRDLLEQVLGNLFRNSLQSLESGCSDLPLVSFSMGNAESGSVWLRIEDNGPGIDAAIRERLFTPFVTSKAQGTGLGLAFVKQVLEDHGGSVRCLDRSKTGGACFEMTLPAASRSIETSQESQHGITETLNG